MMSGSSSCSILLRHRSAALIIDVSSCGRLSACLTLTGGWVVIEVLAMQDLLVNILRRELRQGGGRTLPHVCPNPRVPS